MRAVNLGVDVGETLGVTLGPRSTLVTARPVTTGLPRPVTVGLTVGTREGILIVGVRMIACACTSPLKAPSKRTATIDEA